MLQPGPQVLLPLPEEDPQDRWVSEVTDLTEGQIETFLPKLKWLYFFNYYPYVLNAYGMLGFNSRGFSTSWPPRMRSGPY